MLFQNVVYQPTKDCHHWTDRELEPAEICHRISVKVITDYGSIFMFLNCGQKQLKAFVALEVHGHNSAEVSLLENKDCTVEKNED